MCPRRDKLAMNEDISLTFDLPAVARKKVSAAFDGGRITSDGGVMLLAQAERRLGIADQLARVIPDERDADPDILRARIFAIACGYEDADDLDRLRSDPAFKLACSRLPDTGRALCSQPTVSRRECAYLARSYPPDVVMVDYGRPEVMEWCDENGVDFIFGPPGNAVLDRHVDENADDIRTCRALDQKPCLRGFAETRWQNPGTRSAVPALASS